MYEIIALYLRLSKEDELPDESNSISNQRRLLRAYISENGSQSEQQIVEYIDDGYSGKNFQRPGFQQLIQDIRERKVGTIIVKDFSRLGRDYIEVGNFIEKVFPFLGIRFIAVNNNFDSNECQNNGAEMSMAFQNIMNDYYSEEISIKIRESQKALREKGAYLASYAPFGYKKNSSNKRKLVVDPEASGIVRYIFKTFLECKNKAEVARKLSAKGIPTPEQYKGNSFTGRYKETKKFWSSAQVGKIIRNRVYLGEVISHTREVITTGSNKVRRLPEDEWIVCFNMHESIVSQEEYVAAQLCSIRVPEKKEKRKMGSKDSPIKGFVRCGGCKHVLNRRARLNVTYECRHYYLHHDASCLSEPIKEVDLINIVVKAIRQQAQLLLDLSSILKAKEEVQKKLFTKNRNRQERLYEKIHDLKIKNMELYEKYKSGSLDRETYLQCKHQNENKLISINDQLEELSTNQVKCTFKIFDIFSGKENIEELTREIVELLIAGIYVYSKNRIEIKFNFADELKALCIMAKKSA